MRRDIDNKSLLEQFNEKCNPQGREPCKMCEYYVGGRVDRRECMLRFAYKKAVYDVLEAINWDCDVDNVLQLIPTKGV